MHRRITLIALLAAPGRALSYEMDPYTWRGRPLGDATAAANAHTDEILARAIAATNRRTDCAADDSVTRITLAKAIEGQTDPDHMLWRRGLARGLGFSSFSYWLETDPAVPIRILPRRENIYAHVRLWENWALWLVDGCGVIRMGEIHIGSDKFDHYWDIGWVMYHKSEDGTRPLDALLYSIQTEGNFRGYKTSGAVSYADLRANYDGYLFYAGLLGEDSVVQRGADGCLVQVRHWDWSEVVDRDWDEFLNVSHYTDGAQRGIDRWLEDHGDEICALDEQARQLPPARVPQSEYLLLDQAIQRWGALPPGYDERQDAFRRSERCPQE